MALPAQANSLYLCRGDQGETVITSHADQYKGCRLVAGAAGSTHSRHRTTATHRAEAVAIPAAVPELIRPEIVSAAFTSGGTNTKPNSAVISIAPLQAPPAPVMRTLPSTNVALLEIGKPWPMTVLDAVATDLLPHILDPHASLPSAAPARAPAPVRQAEAAVVAPIQPSPPMTTQKVTVAPPRRGAVYRIRRADGTVEYTNIATRARGGDVRTLFTYLITCYACNVHSHMNWNTVPLHLDAYSDDIRLAAAQSGVDEALLRAVIHAESGFNPQAMSYKGAQGLMQLMPGTASDLGVRNAFDVAENIRGGAKYLAMLLHDFSGNVQLAAAAYNAGEAAVRKYNGVPPFDETQVYVKRVALLRDRYMKALGAPVFAATGSD